MRKKEVEIADSEVVDVRTTIRSASEHRRLLLDAMVALVEGRMNVPQANALATLSGEVHKSLKLEFDILCYGAENLRLGPNNQLLVIEA